MKATKRIIALLLAMIMVLAMATTAFADDGDTPEAPADPLAGHAFTAFQIFKADSISTDGNLGNLAWGSAVPEAIQDAVLATVEGATNVLELAAKLGAMSNDSDAAKAFAQKVYNIIAEYNADESNTTKITGTAVTPGETTLPIGYYLIEDVTVPAEGTTDFVYNLSVLKVSDNDTAVVVTPKLDVPKVDKNILDTEPVKLNEASVGDTVTYQIDGTLPENLGEYETYFYRFSDTLSKGLTYNDNMVVTVDGVDATKYFFVGASEYSATDGTTITVSISDLLALNNVKDNDGNRVFTVTKDSKVVLTYSATLNENAVINGENPNEVDLEYSNNPDDSGKPGNTPPPSDKEPEPEYPTGKTPKVKVVTYTTELTVKKTDQDGNDLTGAKFQLEGTALNIVEVTGQNYVPYVEPTEEGATAPTAYYKLKDGTFTTTVPVLEDDPNTTDKNEKNIDAYESADKYMLVTSTWYETRGTKAVSAEAFVDASGNLKFTGLGEGVYTLKEIVTPTGYNTIADQTITVKFDRESKKFYIEEKVEKDDDDKLIETSMTMEVTIVNQQGSTLPETGGIGTTLFYIVGGLLVAGAGVLLITKRRMSTAK